MIAAAHFDNLLVLLFFGVAILFQLLSAAAAKNRKRRDDPRRRSPSQTSRQLTTEEESSDEDQIRKFLEALGQPTSSKPPSPARPRPTYRRPDVLAGPFGSSLPPLTTRPPDLPQRTELARAVRLPQQIPPTRQAKTFRPTPQDASFEVHRGPQPLETPAQIATSAEAYALATAPLAKATQTKTDFAALPRSKSGLRDAIILREVFGPPRSMQPLDLVGSV